MASLLPSAEELPEVADQQFRLLHRREMPAAFEVGPGCPFADRCAFATPTCRRDVPALRPLDGHLVACHRAEEVADALTIEQDGTT